MKTIRKVIIKDMFIGAKAELFNLALKMRNNPTEAENAMWNILRKYRRSGLVFRRQHPLDFYIADFYCHKLRLVIEVDGEIHSEKEIQVHDEGRTGELERYAIKVIRFTNRQILLDKESVINEINQIIENLKLSECPSLLTPGEGTEG